jgi:hypothetical protein
VLSTAGLAGDTAPPYTYDDFDGAAHRTSVSVALKAGDVGGEVASTEFRVDVDADWSPYSGPIAFEAPADHSNDGRHWLQYRSTDDSGNVECDYGVEVPIDTVGPSTSALRGATVRRGGRAAVVVRVDDAVSRRARVTLRFARLSDGRAARPVAVFTDTNQRRIVDFRATMPPGRYRVTVEARDDAGNQQVHAGTGLLVVRPAGSGESEGTATAAAMGKSALRAHELVSVVEARYGTLASVLLSRLWPGAFGAGQQPRGMTSRETVAKR